MTKQERDEIRSERRQLWCEALLIAMQNSDPLINQPGHPVQIADNVLAAYDKKFTPVMAAARSKRFFKPMPFSQEEKKR